MRWGSFDRPKLAERRIFERAQVARLASRRARSTPRCVLRMSMKSVKIRPHDRAADLRRFRPRPAGFIW